MLASSLHYVGRHTVSFLADVGATWRLAVAAGSRFVTGPFRPGNVHVRATIDQCVRAGYSSLPLVALISFLMGMIMALQSAYQLNEMGALDLVAALVAVAVTRELAPLLTAVIVAGRVGSAIAAELGTMKVSQEIDALTVMGIEPVSFLVVPRLVALVVALPRRGGSTGDRIRHLHLEHRRRSRPSRPLHGARQGVGVRHDHRPGWMPAWAADRGWRR
jgi:phospholipid/cholesterol/gamma-HCH transport system permease protein